MTYDLRRGDARVVLATLPDASVDAVVTSPPYWGLRVYADATGQAGSESTPDEYVANLVAIGRELWRVLRPDGNLLLNLGDSYTGSANSGGANRNSGGPAVRVVGPVPKRGPGLKPKDLIGVPWRVAFALQAAGWYLRAEIIWHKPNPMPESVRDRVTRAHESVFHLTRAPRYYWNGDAIREKYAESESVYAHFTTLDPRGPTRIKKKRHTVRPDVDTKGGGQGNGSITFNPYTANARSVWTIPTEPSPYEHFAVMPNALARKCIVASCPPGGVVLDPFAGVCTTGAVAIEEGRNFIGVELSPTYQAIGRERLRDVLPLFASDISQGA